MHGIAFLRSNNFELANWQMNDQIKYHVIAQVDATDSSAFESYYRTASIDKDESLNDYVQKLIGENDISFVIGHSEYDLVKSAQIREQLNLQGQSVDSSNAYRDKHLMKHYAAKKGVKVAECALVEDQQTLDEVLNRIGLPCIVKPVAGGGSRNTFKITDSQDSVLETVVYPQLVEKFIEGDMYHVDGIVENGEVRFASVSRYTTSCMAYQEGKHLGSTMVDFNSEIDSRMREQTALTVAALPYVEKMAFHAEYFLTPEDEIYLCEIAARSGGALVPQAIIEAYDVNINASWIKQMQGDVADFSQNVKPRCHSGWLVVPPKNATLLTVPQQLPNFEWLSHYKVNGVAGKAYEGPASSVCNVAVGVVVGKDMAEVENRLEQLRVWLESQFEWAL